MNRKHLCICLSPFVLPTCTLLMSRVAVVASLSNKSDRGKNKRDRPKGKKTKGKRRKDRKHREKIGDTKRAVQHGQNPFEHNVACTFFITRYLREKGMLHHFDHDSETIIYGR